MGIWKQEEQLFKIVSGMSIDALFEYDVSEDYIRIYRWTEEGNLRLAFDKSGWRRYLYRLTDPSFFKKLDEVFLNLEMEVEKDFFEFRVKQEETQQDYVWISCRFLHDEKTKHYLGYFQEVTEHAEQNLKLYDEAKKDSLTKLWNKGHSEQMIRELMNQGGFGALFIIDVDNFKAVNDNLGHLFGDEVIVSVANGIQSVFRTADVVGRIGGDEFVAFLNGVTSTAIIRKKAQKICDVIREIYTGEDSHVKISASVGIAMTPQDDTDFSELFKKADHALYYTKNLGKNGFTFYDSQNEEMQKHHRVKINARGLNEIDEEVDEELDTFYFELNELAFALIDDTKNTDSAINLLLRKVKHKFGFDCVQLFELTGKDHTLRCAYEVCNKDIPKALGKDHQYNESEWNMFYAISGGEPHIYEDSQNETYDLNEQRIRSKMILSLSCNNAFGGILEFTDYEKDRKFTAKEKKVLKAFAKIISVYIINRNMIGKSDVYNTYVRQLGERDSLTGLYKYDKFLNKLETECYSCEDDVKLVYIYADIANFKYINESLGYSAGDNLLKRFVKAMCEESDFKNNQNALLLAGRPHSDNIIMVYKADVEIPDEQIIQIIEQKAVYVNEILDECVPTANLMVNCGVYIDSERVKNGTIAIHCANTAKKIAKERHDGKCVWFDADMKAAQERERYLLENFQEALHTKAFHVRYQPQLDMISKTVIAAEAICCWNISPNEYLKPEEYMDILEDVKQKKTLELYILEEICGFLNRQEKKQELTLPIAMNITKGNIISKSFFEKLQKLLDKYQIEPKNIRFEINEEEFISDRDSVIVFCKKAEQLGILTGMDSFGVGNSSLNILGMLPIKSIKLDRRFMKNSDFHEEEEIILTSIVDMIKGLRKVVGFEGISLKEQNRFIEKIGCDYVQGNYYSAPLDEEAYVRYLKTHCVSKIHQAIFSFDGTYEEKSGLYSAMPNGMQLHFAENVLKDRAVLALEGGAVGRELVELKLGKLLERSFTVSMWYKETAQQVWASLFYADFDNAFISVIPRVWNGVESAFRVMDKNVEFGYYDATSRRELTDEWTHIAVVYNRKDRQSAIFINGAISGYKNDVLEVECQGRVALGGDIYQPSFVGYVSELHVTDVALTAQEIEQEYEESKRYYQ